MLYQKIPSPAYLGTGKIPHFTIKDAKLKLNVYESTSEGCFKEIALKGGIPGNEVSFK